MPKRFLSYFGHLNIDVSIRVKEIPINGSINATSVEERYGGTAGNFAIIANRLGVPFDLYAAVSEKTHSDYDLFLMKEGIDTEHLRVYEDSYGPVCYIASDGGKQVAFVFQGPMENWDVSQTYNKNIEYEWSHFSTGPPLEYLKVAEKIRDSKIVFDPGQEISYRYSQETVDRFLNITSLFIGNSYEYEALQQIAGLEEKELRARIKNVIITQGSSGVFASFDGKVRKFRSQRVKGIFDTIGAGDAFRAGFYYGLYNRHTMEDSIICGIIVASEAIMKPITEFNAKPQKIESLLEERRESMLID